MGRAMGDLFGLQLPAGLRRRASTITGALEELGYNVIISGDPSYGACDIADEDMRQAGAELLLHFGHSPMIEATAIPVEYIEVRDDIALAPCIEGNIDMIATYGCTIGIVTTVQHVHKLADVGAVLAAHGINAVIGPPGSRVSYPGQVLGCSFEAAHAVTADAYLFIGTGYFHPVGISLATDRPVLACNPYTGTCEDISPIRDKIVRKRYGALASASSCERFGIVVSTKRGQYRHGEAMEIQNLLRNHGKKCQLIYSREINMSLVSDFDFQAYIVVACPRIAIDDAATFDKPVLTATEARLLFSDGPYAFDEIHELPR
jgi:2-(3-amino-3-carboxypropyl)histidine synthase